MDPNVLLNRLRQLVPQVRAEADGGKPDLAGIYKLADDVEALDAWLARGGFLPDAWRGDDPSLDVSTAWRGAELLWGAGNVGAISLVKRLRDGQVLWCATAEHRVSPDVFDGAGPTPAKALAELILIVAARQRALDI